MRPLRLSVISVVVVVASLSCGGGAPQPSKLSSTWRAPAILSNVPADSPYVFAELEPMSEKLRRRMMRGIDRQITEGLRAVESARAEGAVPTTFEPWMRAALAVADELRGKDMASWWKELGFDPDGRFALYGLSVWPVARAEVANPARLRSVISRALAAAGVQPKQGSLGGTSYWIAGGSEISFVAAVLEREAVVAILPTQALPTALPFVLGQQKPARSLASTATVPELLGRHRLLGFMLAYIDVRSAIDIVTSQRPSELDAPLHALTGPIAPACRSDLERLAAIAPRMVFGYRKLDDVGFDAIGVVETAPGATSGLNKLHAVVPELTTSSRTRPLLSLGAAINPDELVAWLRGVTKQLHDRPFACPWFNSINEAGDKLARELAAPLPPMLKGVRGFSLTIDDATITPLNIDGHLIVAGERIADTVSSFAATLPWLAGIPIKRDGRPVAIPTQQLGLPIPSVHVAMTSDRVVIASGSASAQRVTDHLATPAPSSSPLFMMAFDTPRLVKLLASLGQTDTGSLDSFGHIGMSLDVVGDGFGLDVWGTWDDTPPPPSTIAH